MADLGAGITMAREWPVTMLWREAILRLGEETEYPCSWLSHPGRGP